MLLHLPMTPLLALFGLVGFLISTPEETQAGQAAPITEIPVELLGEDQVLKHASPPESNPSVVVGEPAGEPIVKRTPELDAGAPEPELEAGAKVDAGEPDKSSAEPDAGLGDAGAADAAVRDAAGSDELSDAALDGGVADAGDAGDGIGSPIGVSGAEQRVANADANVSIKIDAKKLRAHSLGRAIGALLQQVPQWREFFGPTGLDPVRDVDRVLIWGPQLRDSSEVGAILNHNLGMKTMRAALNILVDKSPNGAWLKGRVPTARATVDRAERYFVLPGPQVVVMGPKSLLDAAQKVKPNMVVAPLPAGVVASAHLVTPWRPFARFVRIPKSIAWLRVDVAPLGDGAVLRIDAKDESAELAEQHAPELERLIRTMTQLDLGVLGALFGQRPKRFVDKIELLAEGDRIVGRVTATEKQLNQVLQMVGARVGTQGRSSIRPNAKTPSTGGQPPRRLPDALPSVPNAGHGAGP